MSAGDGGPIEKCLTCGKKLEAYEKYMDCPEKRDEPRGQRQHGPVERLSRRDARSTEEGR